MRFLTALTKISKTAYLVAFVNFLIRVGQFMSLPFLAIYLARDGLLTPSQIGMVLGISGLVTSVTGLFNGMYVDRSAHKNTLIIALLLAGLCYFGFAFSMHLFYGLLLLNAALGWFRSLAEISAITMLVTHTESGNLSYAYSARFIGANLGVALGPLIGALMAGNQSLLIFFIAGALHIGLGLAILFYRDKPTLQKKPQSQGKIWANFREVLKDKLLITITLINFILWIVYSQLDTTLPQYLAHTWGNPAVLFSTLMIINATICVFFQPIILRWAELTSLKISGICGSLMFALSFLLLGTHPTHFVMIIAVTLMSFAELFTLPINGLLVMRISPKHLIASYNGFTTIALLGLSVGPLLGGIGLQFIGGQYIFLVDALLPLIAVWLYLKYIKD
jgi:MFS family permease